jgi:class 3 adenylate cyclase/tetratricopeptide (TPR) repeat protein
LTERTPSPENLRIAEKIADLLDGPAGPKLTPEQRKREVASAMAHLEALVALGYEIAPPAKTGAPVTRSDEWQAAINTAGHELSGLRQIWAAHDPEVWGQAPATYMTLAGAFLDCGEPLLAFDVVRKGLERHPADYRLRQLCALALLRSGAVESARAILLKLIGENSEDEESLGMLARAEKNLALSEVDPERRRRNWVRAFKLYRGAFQRTGGYWTGINAATIGLVLGNGRVASRLANEVARLCRDQIHHASVGSNLFWVYATLGEACLVLGREPEAAEHYQQAMALCQGSWGSIASMRRNVKLILESAPRKFSLDQALPVPPVVVFTGHMLDADDRAKPRFPASAVPHVQAEITKALGGAAGICYSSAACGSDILALEENARLGGQNHIVLPFPAEEFIRTSVAGRAGDWERRFRALLESAAKVYVLSTAHSAFSSIEYEFTNAVLLGLAWLKARELDSHLRAIAVWDGAQGEPGGTSHAIEAWRRLAIPTQIITPVPGQAPSGDARRDEAGGVFSPELRAILFGDALGFSRLVESQIPTFFEDFMGTVGRSIRNSEHPPLSVNAWGDGLYMVFDSPRSAGCFALKLHERLRVVDWASKGLPGDLALRIGLHAGPVYACTDPVTGLPTFVGAQVTRAARLEPITPPGKVYVSEQFAALAAAEGVHEFDCEYVGTTPAAKGYGDYPTYVLHSRQA